MNIQDRHKAYSEYLTILESTKGVLTEKAVECLNDAFDVTQEDLDSDINEIIKNSNNSPVLLKSAQLRVLMEDLRDYRDSLEIKKNRRLFS